MSENLFIFGFSESALPVSPPATETKSYSFPSSSVEIYEDIRIGYDSSVNLDAAILDNCSAVYLKNGATVTGSQTFAIGDTLSIEITRTIPAAAASVELVFTYKTNIVTVAALDYFWATWTNLTTGVDEMIVDTSMYLSNKNGLRSAGTSIASWNSRNANSVESLSGLFTIEAFNIGFQATLSLSSTNVGVQSFFSDKYAILSNIGGIYVWESGAMVADISPPNPYNFQVGIRIVDTGAAIQYWRQDVYGGAWILAYTSAAVYVPSAVFYINYGTPKPNTLIEGVKIYS